MKHVDIYKHGVCFTVNGQEQSDYIVVKYKVHTCN